jgi:hypothetical protein
MIRGSPWGHEPRADVTTRQARGSPGEHVAAVCFPQARVDIARSQARAIHLDARRALALAELLQVLSCGEESASVTFDQLQHSWHEPAVRGALTQIASDERQHQVLLATLTAALPQPRPDPALQATMRRFFMRLAHRDALVHFVRIAAIDSAACHLLALLRGRRGPLATDSHAASVLERIHTDEARHVVIARRCAGPLLDSAKGRDIADEMRTELTHVLQLRADSLETLAIDPDRLRARLRSVAGISRAR